ncbi:hypothetical protein [Halobacteriovorax sp.]|uniref:hypothetical protein n=1 Tax=Halobacteriovorax sp. TaxID=2020862 RepID=UPI0035648706
MKRKLFLSIIFLVFTTNICAQAIMDTQYGSNVDTENLTDQQKDESENFVHNEKAQRIYEEECTADGDTEDACLGNKADPKFLGLSSSMVSALSKAYVMIMSTAGGDLDKLSKETGETSSTAGEGVNDATTDAPAEGSTDTVSSGDQPPGNNTNPNGKEDKQKDYCKYIPVATEAIAMLNTTTEQDSITNLPTSEDTAQRDSLLKAAANHDSRAKTAKIQTTGWGAGTACYVAMMASPDGTFKSTSNLLKLGASALLTTFYMNQIKAHEDYADKTKAIADKMPSKGDCNPITDKLCFCTEESSKTRADYQTYCQPEMSSASIAATSERTTCVDGNAQDDPSCTCAQTDTCISKKVMTTISGFGGTSLTSNPAISNFSTMANGELTSGSLTSAQTSVSNALAKLKQLDSKVELEPNVILTQSQQEESQLLQDMGMPANLSTKVATTTLSPSETKTAQKFTGGIKGSTRRYSISGKSKKKNNVLTFSGGDGINSNNKKTKTKKPDFLSRLGLKKKKMKKNNQAVLKFAQQAEGKAQISNNSDRKIFDIISRRYQVSGWRRLEYIK